MSFLNAIKSAIYEDVAPVQQVASQPAVVGATPVAIATTTNTAMVDAIRKAVMSRNTAFTTLMAAADKLATVIPDSSMRLKAAYATSSDGRDVKQIDQAIQIHLADIDGEELRFAGAIKTEKLSVATVQAQVETHLDGARSAQVEIKNLQDRIIALEAAVTEMNAKAAQAAAQAEARTKELDASVQEFKRAADTVRAELTAQKTTIISTLN